MSPLTQPAPALLETVRALINTRDVEDGTDELASPAALERWLRDAALLGPGSHVTADDLANAVAVREALRSALAANHDDAPIPGPAVATLSEAADRAHLSLAITADSGWVARPRAEGVDGALGALLAIVAAAMSDGTWRRLKICVNDTCQWAFYDLSRARTAKWCSMQVCGNRAKQQAWRARHDAAG